VDNGVADERKQMDGHGDAARSRMLRQKTDVVNSRAKWRMRIHAADAASMRD